MPKVSVLIPCYNAARFVGRTLASLRAQTFEDWECVLVDDGSTDESSRVVDSYAEQDFRIRLIQQPNRGVASARNRAYAAAAPDSAYLLFLDADDCLEPTMLEVLVSQLDKHRQVCLAYCGFAWIGQNEEPVPAGDSRLPHFLPTRYVPSGLGIRVLDADEIETPFISIFCAWAGLIPSNSLLRRSVYALTPGWDESLGQPAEDTDVFLHMALRGTIHYVPQKLLRYRRHDAQSTFDGRQILEQDRKLFRKWANIGDLTSDQRVLVKRARWFRESRVLPFLSMTIGASHLSSGNPLEALKCLLRAVKQFGISLRLIPFDG